MRSSSTAKARMSAWVMLGVMFALCLPRIRCGAGHRRNAWLKEQGLLSVKDLWCKAQGYSA
jgi:hypothetical protein